MPGILHLPIFRCIIRTLTDLSVIILLHGEDSFTSGQKLAALKDRFIEKHGESNVHVTQGNDLQDSGTFITLARTLPFLGEKRLIIIRNFFASKQPPDLAKRIAGFLPELPEHMIVVFYESTAVPRTKNTLLTVLQKIGHVEECAPLTSYKLRTWITEQLKRHDKEISPGAITALIEAVGTDLRQLSSEIEKLALLTYGEPVTITEHHVKLIVPSDPHADVFRLIDAIGRRDMRQAAIELQHLRMNGQHALYILTMIAYHARTLIQARDTLNQGKSKADLIQRARMHPFAAEKALRQATAFTLTQLTDTYTRLHTIDQQIKNGRIDPDSALDHLVISLCSREQEKTGTALAKSIFTL